MGAGIRPTGSFPYALLRSKEHSRPPCFGENANATPDPELCEACAHLDDCKREFYKEV